MSSQGGKGRQKFPILPSKKTTKRGGGGKKLLFWDDIVLDGP